MTDQEKAVIEKSVDLWNEFRQLPVIHNDDTDDVRFHLHAIQNIIFARKAQREYDMK